MWDDDDDDDAEAEALRDEADIAHLTDLINRAAAEPEAMRELKGMTATLVFRACFTKLLVDHARKGKPAEPWKWALRYLPYEKLKRIDSLLVPRQRITFTKKGALAAAIAERFEAQHARAEKAAERAAERKVERAAKQERTALARVANGSEIDPPLLEKRRRAGEMFAGIPKSTAALLLAGKLDQAVKDYATRYELAQAVARRVVMQHAPKSEAPAKRRR